MPIKLSLYGPEEGAEEHVELDDELAGKVRTTLAAHPELTMADVIREGIEHVVGKHGGHSH